MAVLYGTQMAKLRGTNPTAPAPGFVDGSVRHFVEIVTFASQTTSDTIEVARLPKGAVPLHVYMLTDTSTGSATIALGISGTTAKYKTAAAYTTTGAWTEMYGTTPAAALGVALANEEILFLTIAAAALPASGSLRIHIVYAFN